MPPLVFYYGLRPVDYACWRMLWITRAVLAVDYGPVGPVDYARGARCGLEEWGEVGAIFAPTPLRQD